MNLTDLEAGTHAACSAWLALVLSPANGARSRGRPMDPLTIAPAQRPGQDVHLMTTGPAAMTESLAASMHRATFGG